MASPGPSSNPPTHSELHSQGALPGPGEPGAWPVVCFDLDGTLLEAGEGAQSRLLASLHLAAAGRSWPPGSLPARGAPPPSKPPAVALPGTSAWSAQDRARAQALCAGFEHEARRFGGLCSLPGADRLLAELHGRGYRLFVVTNASQSSAERALEGLGLAGWIERVLGIDPRRPTDKGRRLRELAEELAPLEALMLGDSAGDLAAAQDADMPGLHFRGSGASSEEGQGAAGELWFLPDLVAPLGARARSLGRLLQALARGPSSYAVRAAPGFEPWAARLIGWVGRAPADWAGASQRVWLGPPSGGEQEPQPAANWRLNLQHPLDPRLEGN